MNRVLTVALALFTSAAAFALSVGPEIPLADSPLGPAPFERTYPRVASNGRDFLVVWLDNRISPYELRAMRIDHTGALLDGTGLRLGKSSNTAVPSVASDGHDYVVAYDCSTYELAPAQCLARIDSETGQVELTERIGGMKNGALASNGRSYMLTYQTGNGASLSTDYVEAIEIGRDGKRAGTALRLDHGYLPAIATNGDTYFIVWSTYARLAGARVSEKKVLGGIAAISGWSPSWGPGAFSFSLASDGDGYLVAWQQNTGLAGNTYTTQLMTQAFAADGTYGPVRSVATSPDVTWMPAMSWTGSAYLLTYTNTDDPIIAPSLPTRGEGDLRRVLLTPSGELASPPADVSRDSGREMSGALASNGTSTLAVWEHLYRTGHCCPGVRGVAQIKARLFSGSGVVESDPIVVSRSRPWQGSPAGTAIGSRAVVAWEENTGERQGTRVVVQRVSDLGTLLDGAGIPVHASASDQIRPAIGGSVIAWVEQSETGDAKVLAKRFGPDGSLLGGAPIAIGDAARDARAGVAVAGGVHLIVWESPEHRIAGARVSVDGSVIGLPIAISSGPEAESNPIVASDGTQFVVVWRMVEKASYGCAGYCEPPRALYSTVVDRSGFTTGSPTKVAPLNAQWPALVWNGSEYALFWSAMDYEPPYDSGLRAKRLDRHGRPASDAVTITRGLPSAAAWNGKHYLLAGIYDFHDPSSAAVATVDRDFRIVERAALPVVAPGAILPYADGRALFAYAALDDDGVARASARWIGDGITRRRSIRR